MRFPAKSGHDERFSEINTGQGAERVKSEITSKSQDTALINFKLSLMLHMHVHVSVSNRSLQKLLLFVNEPCIYRVSKVRQAPSRSAVCPWAYRQQEPWP